MKVFYRFCVKGLIVMLVIFFSSKPSFSYSSGKPNKFIYAISQKEFIHLIKEYADAVVEGYHMGVIMAKMTKRPYLACYNVANHLLLPGTAEEDWYNTMRDYVIRYTLTLCLLSYWKNWSKSDQWTKDHALRRFAIITCEKFSRFCDVAKEIDRKVTEKYGE